MTLRETESYQQLKAMPFGQFVELVEQHAAECFDNRTKTSEAIYTEDDHLRYYGSSAEADRLFQTETALEVVNPMTYRALGQLSERLQGPPMRWLGNEDKVKAPLRGKVVNALLQDRPSVDLLVRHKGELVRAILSKQFTPFDHKQLLDLVGGALSEMGPAAEGVRVHKSYLGDELRAYVLLPAVTFGQDPEGEDGPDGTGGGLHPAAYVSNSETGTGKVRVAGAVYRAVCENGMIVGWDEQDALELVHKHLSVTTIASAVADALTSAFRMSERAAERFLATRDIRLRNDSLERLASDWGSKYGLTVPTIEAWTKMTGNRHEEPSLFEFVNDATGLAKQKSPEEGEAIERMAGELLFAELPPRAIAR